MKRTALILLTAFYLLSCVGMGISRSYCCGKLTSVTFTYGAGDNTASQTAKKDNCCKHEKQDFKVRDSHFSVASLSLNHPIAVPLHSFINPNNGAVGQFHAKIVYRGNAPPGHPDIPAYTLNCAYRI